MCVSFRKGELQQLSGLGLADNPLCFPPPEVVRKGTSAVLSFLRTQFQSRRATEEGGGMGGEVEEEGGHRGIMEDSGTDSGKSSQCNVECTKFEAILMHTQRRNLQCFPIHLSRKLHCPRMVSEFITMPQ